MKNNKRRKETHKGHCLIFQGRYDISFLRVVFESFDVHLSLIHKKRPQHKANEAKQGEFINNISNYPKTIGALFIGKWHELVHFVTQLLEWYK